MHINPYKGRMEAAPERCIYHQNRPVAALWGPNNEGVCFDCWEDLNEQAAALVRQPKPERKPMTQRERNAYWLLAYAVFMAIVWFGWQWGPSVLQFWERVTR